MQVNLSMVRTRKIHSTNYLQVFYVLQESWLSKHKKRGNPILICPSNCKKYNYNHFMIHEIIVHSAPLYYII